MNFKHVFVGLAAVLLGCVVAPITTIIWCSLGRTPPLTFSPMGLVNHMTSSSVFWLFLIVLFAAGYAISLFRMRHG